MHRLRIIVPLLLFPLITQAQHKLSIAVQGVKTSEGTINVAVYDKSDAFLTIDKVYKVDSVRANKGVTYLDIDGLPEGEYALAIFHDENGNEKLDTNWLRIPKEPIGFSIGRMKTFGPPGFKDCAFRVDSDKHIQVSL